MITFTDSRTNTTYSFKGTYVPLTRISPICSQGEHELCSSAPQHLIKYFDVALTKMTACLCSCHHD